MPFLRRRGVMASESDMRRHTTLFESKSPADAFLTTQSTSHPPEHGPTVQAPDTSRRVSTGPIPAIEAARASEDYYDRPDSPPIQDETPRHRRFNMLRFRNASDSQLSAKWRQLQQAEKPPPMPEPPTIITTAPTFHSLGGAISSKKASVRIPLRMRRSSDVPRGQPDATSRALSVSVAKREKKLTASQRTESPAGRQAVTFEESQSKSASISTASGISEDHGLMLPIAAQRLSESSRSEGGSLEHIGHNSQNASSSNLFRFGRRKQRQPEPLFPLGHLPQRSKTPALSAASPNTPLPRNSTSTTPVTDVSRPSTSHDRSTPLGSPGHGLNNLANKMAGSPATALFRPSSRNSGQYSPTRSNTVRGRSSTMSSLSESFVDPQQLGASRTSSSTGRKSFGDLLGLSRMRQNTDLSRHGTLTPATPVSSTSKNSSLQLVREAVVLPERRDDETPAKYLARVEGVLARGTIASALSKETDPFYTAVLRSYMRSFSFFEEPMDMAIRKLLMEAELPKETQQIDRCLQAFANRYHECNPGIYATPDQAYFIAFSLLILHTDVFNKNNKYKMQKADYIKNTRVEGIFDDVLECFYDNVSYTPFIHLEDDFHVNGDRAGSIRLKKKSVFPSAIADPNRKARDLIDPYTLILDGKLDILRPPLKDQIPLEEHYSYLGTANRLNLKELQKTFFKTGVLQIVSARSRPDAFMTEKTQNNPDAAHPGIVDIKVTKVGVLWRKEANKKRRTRSPWQEWGAILTGAQLYFFRNASWVKSLVHQHEIHVKAGHDGVPLIFKPPLENFKPDALMSTEGAVALWDCNYKRHKNAFIYVRHGGLEEVLLAQSEDDRNDWLAKLNYAAAFKTSGVRMRGVIGGNYEGQSRRAIRRLDSASATQHIQTPTGEVAINRSRIDHQMAQDILVARQAMMRQKIEEAEEKLEASQKHVDTQLRNARHLLVLAPIQERTREQVCNGAAKIIAQLKWSRMDFWRLKCHRDVLAMDLAEERETNGDFKEISLDTSLALQDTNDNESIVSQQAQESTTALSPVQTADLIPQSDTESLNGEVFHTPPSGETLSALENRPLSSSTHSSTRKMSLSSVASLPTSAESHAQEAPTSPSQTEPILLDGELAEDERERHVLEEAGLLEPESGRTPTRRPGTAYTTDDIPDRGKRGSISGADKDQLDKGKVRRSLQRTLRDGAGHLSHHRSKRGRDSTTTSGPADDSTRDEVLSRGAGSFTVHGKKASVINFGNELQGIVTDEHLKTRKGSEPMAMSPVSIDDSHDNLSQPSERRESVTSASTATARSFRDLHRKYSSSRANRAAAGGGNLVVPADEDSDAALSVSDGRRSPLPPLNDDDDEDGEPSSETPQQAQLHTPDAPSSPVQQNDTTTVEEGKDEPSCLQSSAVQEVNA